MPEDPHVAIGRLRWQVTIANRSQVPDPNGPGILETIEGVQLSRPFGRVTGPGAVTVFADVQPVGAHTFYGAEQVDAPVTDRIFMRWHDILDQTKVVLRDTTRPDGSVRREVFRIRRIKELGGRKRFVMLEAELERVDVAPPAVSGTQTDLTVG